MADDSPTTSPGARPASPLAARRHVVGYVIFVAASVAAILAGMAVYRGWIDRHQRGLERYAAERAIEALDRGDLAAARAEVAVVARDRPIRSGGLFGRKTNELWEGPVLRNRVGVYEQLCARLLKAGLAPEARAVAWKAILEYHISSRPLEMFVPWEMAALSAAACGDWFTAFQSARILAAHGADTLRTPADMNPIPFPENPAMFKDLRRNLPPTAIAVMKLMLDQPAANQWDQLILQLRKARAETANPAVAGQIDRLLHQACLAAGKTDQARQLLVQKWGGDPALIDREPSLMDYVWAEKPSGATGVAAFMDAYGRGAAAQVSDFSGLEPHDLGYFSENNKFTIEAGVATMPDNVAGAVEIETKAPVGKLAIGYRGTPVLEVGPILLIQVDEGPFTPIYCEGADEAIAMADVNIPAGRHSIKFVFLNDGLFSWPARQIEENRGLTLYRFALIHTKR